MRLTLRRNLRLIAAFVVLVPLALAAAQSGLPPELVSRGWEEITFDGKPANRYAVCGADCVEIETDASVSMIGKPVSADLSRLPGLTWEWKVESPVAVSDLRIKGQDDRAVAVYVAFPYDSETATFFENMLRPLFVLLRGADAPGRMLSYVWGGFGTPGEVVESPYFGGVNAIIVVHNQATPVGGWIMERVNVVADHQRAFGTTPSMVSHILVSADSDDTGTRNRAFVRNIMFAP